MKQYTVDTTLPKNLALLMKSRSEHYPDIVLQASKNNKGEFEYFTYKKVYEDVILTALALQEMGIKKEDRIGLISDNRREWLITDLALLSLGACDVPRGCDSMGSEIRFILSFAECSFCFFENARQLEKVLEKREEVPSLKTAILFEGITDNLKAKANEMGITLYRFDDIMLRGEEIGIKQKGKIESIMEQVDGDDLATIIFTSGTTGTPKGVMLTHRNYLAQCEVVHNVMTVQPGHMWLSVLPVWHSFERVIQYLAITFKSGLAYSKPIASAMLPDLAVIKPQWMCGVPRLWESIAQGVYRNMRKEGGVKLALFSFFISIGKKFIWGYEHVTGRVCRFTRKPRIFDFFAGLIPFIFLSPLYGLGELLIYKKIRAKLGGRFVAAISGGGALQNETDAFYRAIGFKLLEGYGITEAAPILAFRSCGFARPGCVGYVYPSAQIKIVPENQGKIISMEALGPGKRGLILAKGDQIMKGYYKRPDLTESAIDKDGWFNTGDLGMMTYDNEIKITGRAKDTIVLLGGENIEPSGIEGAMCA
ncbi:MAG TPA: AMP-binding protein, partial [Treponemataceae bacterium]|nr:AMP-binding protein [Treponemataceae bacterium]